MTNEIRFTFDSDEDRQEALSLAKTRGLKLSHYCKMLVYQNLNSKKVE